MNDLVNDNQIAAIAFEWKTDGNFIVDGSHGQHLNSPINLLDIMQ